MDVLKARIEPSARMLPGGVAESQVARQPTAPLPSPPCHPTPPKSQHSTPPHYTRSTNPPLTKVGLELEGTLRNPTGHGETLTGSYKNYATAGAQFDGNMQLKLSKPRVGGLPVALTAELDKQRTSRTSTSSFTEQVQAARVQGTSHDGAHTLQLEGAFREVMPAAHPTVPGARAASFDVLQEAARPSTKVGGFDRG